MKFVAVLLACVALASAHSIHNQKNLIEDVIKGIIENLRPKLVDLHVDVVDLREWGSLSNLNVKNAETFVVEVLQTENALSTNIKNLTISIADASATSDFDIKHIEIPEIGAGINGVGALVGAIKNGWITLALKNKLQGTTITVTDISNYGFQLEDLQATMTGIDNADQNNAAINAGLAKLLVEKFPQFVTDNKQMIIDTINKALAGSS